MCRAQFHIRSDLDLRIIRRRDSRKGYIALFVSLILKIYSFFVILPVDLQVVDSVDFLNKQMRIDEKPIIVFKRQHINVVETGLKYVDILRNPNIVLKRINL